MADTIIEALRDYFLLCPLMDNSRINVDYLPEKGIEYTINTTPTSGIIKRYVNGDTLRQYLFTIGSVNDYGSDVLQNIANSGFYEKLEEWLEEQNEKCNFPLLPDGKAVAKIQASSIGYLFVTSTVSGRYQIQCRLEYEQKGQNYGN